MEEDSDCHADMHSWELYKENAIPLKRGRPEIMELKEHVESTLGAGRMYQLELEQQRRESICQDAMVAFQEAKKHGHVDVGPDTDFDPLKVWFDYISWIRMTFPQGNNKLMMRVLEMCTSSLQNEEVYRNDPGYLDAWIAYANMLPDPTELFRFLRTKGIGKKLAKLYIATAIVAERRGDFPLAGNSYRNGILENAEPLKELQTHEKHFLRRMARHWLKEQEKQQPQQNSGGSPRLSQTRELSATRPPLVGTSPRLQQPLQRARAQQSSLSSSSSSSRTNNTKGGGFQVYEEPILHQKAHNDWVSQGVGEYKNLVPETKNENIPKAMPWSKQTIEPSVSMVNKPAKPPAFKVFQEKDEYSSPRGGNNKSVNRKMDDSTTSPLGPATLHQQKIALSSPREERLQKSLQVTTTTTLSKSGMEQQKLQQEEEEEDDQTINTREALKEMESLFGGSRLMSTHQTPAISRSSNITTSTSTSTMRKVPVGNRENISPNITVPPPSTAQRSTRRLAPLQPLQTIEQHDEHQPPNFTQQLESLSSQVHDVSIGNSSRLSLNVGVNMPATTASTLRNNASSQPKFEVYFDS